ncbi:unnamed protein product [Moneuplotes crassus]|uniref:Uncharacterized protein n=1 Tax=Euplotes crassus TaxID=5936 RepID=A0AAD2DBU8_EUPCR|nr:unnamed protein product [Moneuplotes crassus]
MLVGKVSDSITPWSSNKDNILLLATPNDSILQRSKGNVCKNTDRAENDEKKQNETNRVVKMQRKPLIKPLVKLKNIKSVRKDTKNMRQIDDNSANALKDDKKVKFENRKTRSNLDSLKNSTSNGFYKKNKEESEIKPTNLAVTPSCDFNEQNFIFQNEMKEGRNSLVSNTNTEKANIVFQFPSSRKQSQPSNLNDCLIIQKQNVKNKEVCQSKDLKGVTQRRDSRLPPKSRLDKARMINPNNHRNLNYNYPINKGTYKYDGLRNSKNYDPLQTVEACGKSILEFDHFSATYDKYSSKDVSITNGSGNIFSSRRESKKNIFAEKRSKENIQTELQEFIKNLNSNLATQKRNLLPKPESQQRSVKSQREKRQVISKPPLKTIRTRNPNDRNKFSTHFFSQERPSNGNIKLFDVEKFLLKVTSNRQISTPIIDQTQHKFPCPVKSHIPQQILNKFTLDTHKPELKVEPRPRPQFSKMSFISPNRKPNQKYECANWKAFVKE